MDALTQKQITRQLRMLRLASGMSNDALALLEELEWSLQTHLASTGGDFSKARLEALLGQAKERIAFAYKQAAGEVDLAGVADVEAQAQKSILNSYAVKAELSFVLPSAQVLDVIAKSALIEGAPSADWWARQAGDAHFRFASTVRAGVASGATVQQMSKDVAAQMAVTRRNAEALVRSSVMAVCRDVSMGTFKKNDDLVSGIRQVSTLDGRTTTTCAAYSGAAWKLDGTPIHPNKLPFNGGPPRHWNCRSTTVPIVKDLGYGSFISGLRASKDGQVAQDTSFAAWLDSQPKAVADEMLGKGRAQLWRSGKLTLQQLLDSRGRTLKLDDLKRLYAEA